MIEVQHKMNFIFVQKLNEEFGCDKDSCNAILSLTKISRDFFLTGGFSFVEQQTIQS